MNQNVIYDLSHMYVQLKESKNRRATLENGEVPDVKLTLDPSTECTTWEYSKVQQIYLT